MAIEQNGINTSVDDYTYLNKVETRKILTPFAFKIDKSLFGLPLAVPRKRATALMIDLIFIAILAETPGELLALLTTITLYKIGRKNNNLSANKKHSMRKTLLRGIGAVIIFFVLLSYLSPYVNQWLDQNKSTPVVTSINESEVSIISDNTDIQGIDKNHMVYKGVDWFKEVIEDLGLSFGWAALYFSVMTSMWNGQTLGKRVMKIRVVQLDGTVLSVWDSFGRYGGYGAGLATGLMGFIQIYWDANRQCIHDKISSTVVIDVKK